MNNLSRLSDEQVTDPIIRSYLYRDILQAINNGTTPVTEYEIKQDEYFRPDLVSFRAYGTTDLRWLIKLLCDVDDEEDPLPAGSNIYLPEPAFVRDRIRHFAEDGSLPCLK